MAVCCDCRGLNLLPCWQAMRGLETEIRAYGASEFDVQMPNYQVVLLGPQVKYMQQDLQHKASQHGVPVDVINMMDYGMQRGDRVLDHALSLIR